MVEDVLINLLKKNHGHLSGSWLHRAGLLDQAVSMLADGELLLGRSMKDGSYYYGLPELHDNLDIDIRWLSKPILKLKDMSSEEYDAYKSQGRRKRNETKSF